MWRSWGRGESRIAQLIFYDQSHTYEVDGKIIPSVSEILRFISREEYADIDQYKLDNAAERGTAVHKACAQIIKTGECEVTAEFAGYVNAFIQFCEDYNCSFTHSELALACDDYAGTIDLAGTVEGLPALVDLKTVSAVKKTLVKAQLNGYKRLYEHNGLGKIEALYCVQLMANGKYRRYPVAIDSTEFDLCLALHKAAKRKHPRGRIA